MTDKDKTQVLAMTARMVLTELGTFMGCPICRDCPFARAYELGYWCDINDMADTLRKIEEE